MKIQHYTLLVFLAFLFTQCKKGPEYESLIPYQEDEDSYWGYIDFQGNKKIDKRFKNQPGMFYNGYALIETTDGSVDYIDKKGNEFERNYLDASNFHEGIAIAVKESEYPTLLNSKLKEVKVMEKVDEIYVPSEGLMCFKNTECKWGYMNKNGEITVQPVWDYAYSFSEGLALVGRIEFDTLGKDRKEKISYGFIDTQGNEVIKPSSKFKQIRAFSENRAAYSDGDDWGWGFIDKTGEKVIRAKQEWKDVTDFREGIASVKIDGLWGAINKKGKLIINPKFENALFFERGLSYVEKEDKIGFVNKKGDWVIEPSFHDIETGFSKCRAVVEKDNYYVLISRRGNHRKNREFFNISINGLSNNHIRSDFFDIEPVIDTMFVQLSAGSVNGISSKTDLEKIMKKYKISNADLPDNSWKNSIDVRKVNMDDEIDITVTCYFNENVSEAITSRVSYGWYTYSRVTGYSPNSDAQVTSVTFSIDLNGRKEGKGDILAKGIRSVFELNGYKTGKEEETVNRYILTTADGKSEASINYDDDNVSVSVKL
ncbi:MAG: WG repeat-containing protein [Bacteroidales bacterium]|nr:WG repeat-containing protein [Bacteroidales bacterium]